MSRHNFASSLIKGQTGEGLFLSLTGLKKLDGRRHDFIDEKTGETYELKTDSYSEEKTKNFFIELWSDVDRGAPGGPEQALLHGSTYWVYMFPASNVYYKFKTKELCKFLKELYKENNFRKVEIPNRTWTTVGVLVPRELLSSIAERIEFK